MLETTDWQIVEIPASELGSFNKIKIKMVHPFLFLNSRGKVTLHFTTLPTARGYSCLDGREFIVRHKKDIIAYLRTEDCGLGSRKAHLAMEHFGYRI